MADFFLIRTKGGPLDGQTRQVPRDFFGWPLPDELQHPDPQQPMNPWPPGRYVKVSESQLPPDVDSSPHVVRGAEYEWRP